MKREAFPPNFKGVWLNLAILGNRNLSFAEQLIIAEVDALTTDEGPCRASNAHFSGIIGISVSRAASLLARMQRDGHLVQLGFHRTHRDRVVNPIYSNHPERCKKWTASLVENDIPGNEPCRKRQSSLVENDNRGMSKTTYGDTHREIIEKSSSSKGSSTVSGTSPVAGNDDDEKLETDGEVSASVNGEKQPGRTDHGQNAVTPEEEATELLRKCGVEIPEDVKLVKEFGAEHCIDHADNHKDRLKAGQNLGPGYLVVSIRENRPFMKGFKTRAEREFKPVVVEERRHPTPEETAASKELFAGRSGNPPTRFDKVRNALSNDEPIPELTPTDKQSTEKKFMNSRESTHDSWVKDGRSGR